MQPVQNLADTTIRAVDVFDGALHQPQRIFNQFTDGIGVCDREPGDRCENLRHM